METIDTLTIFFTMPNIYYVGMWFAVSCYYIFLHGEPWPALWCWLSSSYHVVFL